MAALKALYSKHRTSFRHSISAAIHGLYENTDESSSPSFRHLGDDEISQLTSILAHQCSPDTPLTHNQQDNYHTLITTQAKKLPARLQSHEGKASGSLCQKHTNFSSRVLRSTLHWVQDAIDVKIPTLIYPLSKANVIPESLQDNFNQLREVCGMWVDPVEYEKFFKREVNPRWAPQSDGCPGCMLARIGGEVDILIALKAGMIACTASSEISTSRRHKWINAWIDSGFDAKNAARIFGEATTAGLQLQEAAGASEQSNQAFMEVSHVSHDNFHAGISSTAAQDDMIAAPITHIARPADLVAEQGHVHDQTGFNGHGNSLEWDAYPLPENASVSATYNPYGWSHPNTSQQRHAVDRPEQLQSHDQSAQHFATGYQRDLDVDAFLRELEEEDGRV